MKEISDLIDERKDEIIEFVQRLIRIPTVNTPPNGNEGEGQRFMEKSYLLAGLEVHTLCPSDLQNFETSSNFLRGRNYSDRYNVIGIWKGNGKGNSLLLSGHMDVVPEDPLPWGKCNPFEPLVTERRIYGRGSADMKSGLAAAFMAVKLLKELEWTPAGDVLLESVVDEEFAGGNGTIASRLSGFNADFAINAEPTGLKLYPACVGALILKISVSGNAGMPYSGEEIYNPVYSIVKIVDILRKYEKYRNENEPTHKLWESAPQKRSIIITKLKSGETKENGQLSTPINAWIEVVIQTFPGESEEDAMSKFLEYLNDNAKNIPELVSNKFEVEKEYWYVEPTESSPEIEGTKVLKQSFTSVTGLQVKVIGAPFSCDLASFQKYGNTPAVLFGPEGGNLHAPDEWVDIESIITTVKVFAQMIINWCG